MEDKRYIRNAWLAATLCLGMAVAGLIGVLVLEPVQAADPVTGAISAKAYTGGVVAGKFVKLSAAGIIRPASSSADKIVGICELTQATTGGLTRYAPPGTRTRVTAGDTIALGDLLTADASGTAVPVSATGDRVSAIALSAGSAAASIDVLVVAGIVGESVDATGALAIGGDVTIAAGKDIAFAAGAGYLHLAGETTGGIRLDPISGGTGTTTIVNSAATATLTLPGLTSLLSGLPATATATDANAAAVPITHGICGYKSGAGAVAPTLANGKPGQVLLVYLHTDGGGDATITPDTPTAWATLVFADAGDSALLMYVDNTIGWIILGTWGKAAPPVMSRLWWPQRPWEEAPPDRLTAIRRAA